jgi:IMP dehydrogenase
MYGMIQVDNCKKVFVINTILGNQEDMSMKKIMRPTNNVGSLLESGFAFNYDDLTLVPRVVSTLQHRTDARPEIRLGPFQLALPLIGSPMPDVCGEKMCRVLSQEGALGILHRFQSIESQQHEFELVHHQDDIDTPAVGTAIGITGDYQERFRTLYASGCRLFCLDTANGAHLQVKHAMGWIRGQASDVFLLAGNVASAEAFSALEEWGADAIRVGIAGGSVCETRSETGVFLPTPYAVAEAAMVRKRALIVGDSGVRTPADFCKLLALGADAVMVGSALAGTKEAPGQVIVMDGKKYKIMRGAASFSVQQQSGNASPGYVEGTETLVPYRDTVTAVLHRYLAGLQSSMSYMNACTLDEYRRNVAFMLLL